MDIYREKIFYNRITPFNNGKNGKLYLLDNHLEKVLFNPSEDTLILNNKLLERKENLKLTNPIEGNLFVDNVCVGSVLPFYKKCAVFSRIIRSHDYDLKYEKLNQVMDAYLELQNNYIYAKDIHEKNILVSYNDQDIHLIDITDYCTVVSDNKQTYCYGLMNIRIKNLMIKTLCFPILQSKEYNTNTLEQIGLDNTYIEMIKHVKDIEDLKEFNEFTHKDNTFKKLLKVK